MVFDKPRGPIELRDVPVPKPGPDEVLINVKYSGVCHTDLHAWKGDWPIPTKLPLIGGHEGAGVVVGKGHLVRNFEIGDLAGIKWLNGSCGTCEFCKETHESNCPEAILSGYTVDGSFQQYAIAKAIQAAPIPPGTDLVQVAPILCAGLTVYTAIRESGVRAGQWLAVTGAGGGLGTLAIQYAKAMGIRVVGIDSGSAKEEWCKKLGATEFIDFTKTNDLKGTIQQVTGGGPHAVVNVAASEKPINEAIEYLRSRGTAVLVGLPPQAVAHADVFSTVLRTITIKGSYVGNRSQTDEAIGFFARGDIHMPIKVVGLSELPMVYDLMEKRQVEGRYVLDTSR